VTTVRPPGRRAHDPPSWRSRPPTTWWEVAWCAVVTATLTTTMTTIFRRRTRTRCACACCRLTWMTSLPCRPRQLTCLPSSRSPSLATLLVAGRRSFAGRTPSSTCRRSTSKHLSSYNRRPSVASSAVMTVIFLQPHRVGDFTPSASPPSRKKCPEARLVEQGIVRLSDKPPTMAFQREHVDGAAT